MQKCENYLHLKISTFIVLFLMNMHVCDLLLLTYDEYRIWNEFSFDTMFYETRCKFV